MRQYEEKWQSYNEGDYEYEKADELLVGINYKNSEEIRSEIKIKQDLKKAAIGSYILFGNYEQDNNFTNGKEKIEWQVLDKEENKILLISKYILNIKPYNTADSAVTWETCSLREWLNKSFLFTAFSDFEQGQIQLTTVSADGNPSYYTNPGNETKDLIYIQSISEYRKYMDPRANGTCKLTEYSTSLGAWEDPGTGLCPVWLRSPGEQQNMAAYIGWGGGDYPIGFLVTENRIGVRPSLWVNIE